MKKLISRLNTKENHRFIIGMLAGIILLTIALSVINWVNKSQDFNPILWSVVVMLTAAFIIVYGYMRWIEAKPKGGIKSHEIKNHDWEKKLYPFIPKLSDVQHACLGFEETMLRTQPYFLKPWRLDQVKTSLVEGFKPWEDLESEPVYFQAMFILLIAAKYRDQKLVQDYSWLTKSFNYMFGNAALNESTKASMIKGHIFNMQGTSGIDLEKEVAEYNSSYFYSQTLLMGLLKDAKQKGVISTSEFAWLKRTDRKLYMALSSVGRYRALPEALGMVAHWKWEQSQGYACKDINVSLAIQGLKLELTKESWNKEDWPTLFGEQPKTENESIKRINENIDDKFEDIEFQDIGDQDQFRNQSKPKHEKLKQEENKEEWKQLMSRLQRLEEEVEFLRGNQ